MFHLNINIMKNYSKKLLFLALGTGLLLTSCQGDQNNNQKAIDVVKDVVEAVKAPEKNEAFYEKMLDIFCRQYYGELFKDVAGTRNYVPGSLKVDSISKTDDKVLVFGKHDFEGRFGNEHEGRAFFASVQENKDKANEYVVTFAKELKGLTSLVGKDKSEAGTKTFFYDPTSSVIDVVTDIIKLKDPAYYERMLDQFCKQNYDEMFKDVAGKRKYVAGSLKVDSVIKVSEREVKVYDKHDFEGRTGKDHSDRAFEANIYETKDKANEYNVSFKKEGKRLITGKPYSETRSKLFIFEE